MNPDEKAHAIINAIYEKIAHGNLEHKAWLSHELSAWVGVLTRVLRETHSKGFRLGSIGAGKPECDECDGGGFYQINGKDTPCVCSEPQESR